MIQRFVVRPHQDAYAVHDTLTGELAVIASTPQTGLSEDDAHHTAELLNRRASEDDGRKPQSAGRDS
jgi:hypothetical protein